MRRLAYGLRARARLLRGTVVSVHCRQQGEVVSRSLETRTACERRNKIEVTVW